MKASEEVQQLFQEASGACTEGDTGAAVRVVDQLLGDEELMKRLMQEQGWSPQDFIEFWSSLTEATNGMRMSAQRGEIVLSSLAGGLTI